MRTLNSLTLSLVLAALPVAGLASAPVLPGTPAAHRIAEAQAADLLAHMAADVAHARSMAALPSPEGQIRVLWRGYAIATVDSEPVCAAVNVKSAEGNDLASSSVTALCVGQGGSASYTVIYRRVPLQRAPKGDHR